MNTKQHAGNSDGVASAKNKKYKRKKRAVVSGAVLGENVHFQETLLKTVKEGMDDIAEQAQRYKDNPLNSRAGYVAEADHCATFNVRKALERDSTRAVREPNGNHGDYKIVKGDKVLVEGEVKYHGSAEKTENAMRGYDDQQLVGPADQIDEIKVIAGKKALKGKNSPKASRQKVGREHEAAAKNASDTITDGKTKSTPRTRKEAQKIARKASRKKVGPRDVTPSLGESMGLAMKSGAKSGAAGGALISGVVSGASNMRAWHNGEKRGEDAIVDTVGDVAISALDGGVKGGVASGATVLASHAANKVASTTLKTVLKSGAPAAAAICCVELAKDAVDLARGEIDGGEFCEKAVRKAASSGGGLAGAKGGALIGSFFGPVGILTFGAAGGVLGYLGVDCLFG